MPMIYGGGTRRRPSRAIWIGVAVSLSVTAAILAGLARYEHRIGSGVAENWAIKGPPCPTISPPDYQRKYARTERIAEFSGDLYARQVGHMSCRSVPDPGGLGFISHPVCQFTGPVALRVRTSQGETLFEMGIGQRATISIAHGETTCVVGGNFTAFDDPT